MNYCSIPDCDKPTEGNTDMCASHNRLQRKQMKEPIVKKPTAIKHISDQRMPLIIQYNELKTEWLKGKVCALKFQVEGLKCWGRMTVHHRRGKLGDNYLDTTTFLPVCLQHHAYIEAHPQEAYKKGWSLLRLPNETI